ncbi:MAG: phosphopyruvate hydratase, partial [Rhodospirillales bacterium]
MSKTRIKTVTGRRVWDSRGRPTLEVEIELRYGALGRAIAPSGVSTGTGEARERRDGGPRFGGLGVDCALQA